MARITILYRAILFLFPGLCLSTLSYCQNEEFDNFIGEDKARVLHQAISSMDSFLVENYRSSTNYNEKVVAFLEDYLNSWNSDWRIDSTESAILLNDFERSGLRKDIWLYNDEIDSTDEQIIEYILRIRHPSLGSPDNRNTENTEYSSQYEELLEIPELEEWLDTLEYNNPVRVNYHSALLAGIHKFSNDTLLREYAEVQLTTGPLSTYIIANAMLQNKNSLDFESYYAKAMLVREFYYDIINTYHQKKNN